MPKEMGKVHEASALHKKNTGNQRILSMRGTVFPKEEPTN